MNHMTEEELIAYREGEPAQRASFAEHLRVCEQCRREMERIDAVLAALDTLPVPDPGADYGRRVWQQIAPRLPEKRVRWWQTWIEPRRLAAIGAAAALIVAAFIAGRFTKRTSVEDTIASKEQIQERILVVAVGEHLGRSERGRVHVTVERHVHVGGRAVEHQVVRRAGHLVLRGDRHEVRASKGRR